MTRGAPADAFGRDGLLAELHQRAPQQEQLDSEELAKALGTEPAEFPGGHNGDLSHPRAYAARLREVLETSQAMV
ncbi:hypothetical protein GCM10023191_031080 [Actinoallomurus oryzae]|uniref:Uncharacterized protein n=1 Tax=Actinoallomurus oryzae TaxID=502180 RepID=A0ABP8PWC7_9ACTN